MYNSNETRSWGLHYHVGHSWWHIWRLYYLRDDDLWRFLSLQELGQGISKGFKHRQMWGLEGDRVGIWLWKLGRKISNPLAYGNGWNCLTKAAGACGKR